MEGCQVTIKKRKICRKHAEYKTELDLRQKIPPILRGSLQYRSLIKIYWGYVNQSSIGIKFGKRKSKINLVSRKSFKPLFCMFKSLSNKDNLVCIAGNMKKINKKDLRQNKRSQADLDETIKSVQREKQPKPNDTDALNMTAMLLNVPEYIEKMDLTNCESESANFEKDMPQMKPLDALNSTAVNESNDEDFMKLIDQSLEALNKPNESDDSLKSSLETNKNNENEASAYDTSEEDECNKTWVPPPVIVDKNEPNEPQKEIHLETSNTEEAPNQTNGTSTTKKQKTSPSSEANIGKESIVDKFKEQKLRVSLSAAEGLEFISLNDDSLGHGDNNRPSEVFPRQGKTEKSGEIRILFKLCFFLATKRKLEMAEKMDDAGDIIIACLITEDYPKSIINDESKKLILRKLDEIVSARNSASIVEKIEYGRPVSRAGIIVVPCHNRKSANYLRLTTENISGKNGSPKVKCLPISNVNFAPAFTLYYPVPHVTFDYMAKLIKDTFGLNTDEWILLNKADNNSATSCKFFFLGTPQMADLVASDRYSEFRRNVGLVNHISIKRLKNEYENGKKSDDELKSVSDVLSFKVEKIRRPSKTSLEWQKCNDRKRQRRLLKKSKKNSLIRTGKTLNGNKIRRLSTKRKVKNELSQRQRTELLGSTTRSKENQSKGKVLEQVKKYCKHIFCCKSYNSLNKHKKGKLFC